MRDAGLRAALWRLHLDSYHDAWVPLSDPATGEALPAGQVLADAQGVHGILHNNPPLAQQHGHRPCTSPGCDGTYLPQRPTPPTPHECDTCGATTHAAICVDDEGKTVCVCGLTDE